MARSPRHVPVGTLSDRPSLALSTRSHTPAAKAIRRPSGQRPHRPDSAQNQTNKTPQPAARSRPAAASSSTRSIAEAAGIKRVRWLAPPGSAAST